MSISYQTSAVGTKTTTGTTFPISLPVTAGDEILVGVNMGASGTFVSSISDGVNTYDQLNQSIYSTGRLMLYGSRARAASTTTLTITVTVSASGSNCAGVAASYRGVAFLNAAGTTTSTGSAGTISSGSITLQEPSGWSLMVGGQPAANTFTAQLGAIRNQTIATTVNVLLMDSNAGNSPVTESAMMTAGIWAMVQVQLRLLEATQLENMNNLNEQLSTNLGTDAGILATMSGQWQIAA